MGTKKSRQKILKNLQAFSPRELAEAIREEVVTLYELSKTGDLSPLTKRRIEEWLTDPEQAALNEGKMPSIYHERSIDIYSDGDTDGVEQSYTNIRQGYPPEEEKEMPEIPGEGGQETKEPYPVFETSVTPSPPAYMAPPLSPAPMPTPPPLDPDMIIENKKDSDEKSSPILPPPFPG